MSVTNNFRWIGVAQFAKIGSQLVNMFVLTRLIPSADYGLIAMAGIATTLAIILRDMGTTAAIIQKTELNDSDTSSIFLLNVFVGFF